MPGSVTKESLRQQVCARLRLMTAEERAAAGARARASLLSRAVWKQAESVLFFAPLAEELDMWPLLAEARAAGKLLALPRFMRDTRGYAAIRVHDFEAGLQTGYFGIREPAPRDGEVALKRVDLILVPGVAFDLSGGRLGRGKGYYDRLLATVSGIRCGVAYDEQIVEQMPVEAHDVRMDILLTPERWVEFRNR